MTGRCNDCGNQICVCKEVAAQEAMIDVDVTNISCNESNLAEMIFEQNRNLLYKVAILERQIYAMRTCENCKHFRPYSGCCNIECNEEFSLWEYNS